MATTAHDPGATPETQADRIRERGGADMPPSWLTIMHEHELEDRAIWADTKISEEHRKELRSANFETTDRRLWTDRGAVVAATKKPDEQKRGQLLGEIIEGSDRKPLAETASETSERHSKAMRTALELCNDMTFASSVSDPDALRDFFEELLLANRVERVRQLAPMIVARLKALSQSNVAGANDAWAYAAIEYDRWKKAYPSRAARLREVDERLAQVEREVDRKYEKLRETFRFGRHAQGMRL
jgi:hypothetical protein